MANWTSANPATAHFATNPINGTINDNARLRLVQNAVSTRIIEGLLAAMLICGAIACVLEGNTRILPKDPGSIAARMSLLADAEIWGNQDVIDELRDVEAKGQKREDLFKGWVFRMGWWDGKGDCVDEGVEGTGRKKRFGIDGTRVPVAYVSQGV